MPIEIKKYKCSRCGKMYEDSERKHFVGKPCEECTQFILKIGRLQRHLIAEDFAIEQEDEKIAKKIYGLLSNLDTAREFTLHSEKDQEILTALTEKLLKNEKRSKKILKHILKLQKKKRF